MSQRIPLEFREFNGLFNILYKKPGEVRHQWKLKSRKWVIRRTRTVLTPGDPIIVKIRKRVLMGRLLVAETEIRQD